MFMFQTIGKVMGQNSSRDGRMAYLKLLSDPQEGIDIDTGETPDVLDVHIPMAMMPQGCGLGTRVAIEGTGAITVRSWTPTNQPGAKPKLIQNTRMQARSIKLAK